MDYIVTAGILCMPDVFWNIKVIKEKPIEI